MRTGSDEGNSVILTRGLVQTHHCPLGRRREYGPGGERATARKKRGGRDGARESDEASGGVSLLGARDGRLALAPADERLLPAPRRPGAGAGGGDDRLHLHDGGAPGLRRVPREPG